MPGIIVDIDWTIYDARVIDSALAEKLGYESADELNNKWQSLSDEERDRAVAIWHQIMHSVDAPEIPHAKEVLKTLEESGYRIFYLTGREKEIEHEGTTYDLEDVTEKWLEKHGFPEGELHVVGWHKCGYTKMEAIEKIVERTKGPIYGIGDRKSDMVAYSVHGVIPVLFHNPEYHLAHRIESEMSMSGLVRISTWNEFLEFMRSRPSVDFVVGGFIKRNGKVLLINHKQIGKWLPPGGHMEKWESPDEAIVREMKEETGMDVEFLDHPDGGELHQPFVIHRHNIHLGHDHIMFGYFLNAKGEFRGNNEGAWHWFTEDEIRKGERDGAEIPDHVRKFALMRFRVSQHPQ